MELIDSCSKPAVQAHPHICFLLALCITADYTVCVLACYRDLMAKEEFGKLGYHNEQTNEGR